MAIPFIDLCSGIGGFHSGLVNTGHYRCVGHAEIDKNAEKAYNAIYGEEGGLNYGDLRTINPRELPHFDMLCGGFPCQSFSVAGRRLGFRDTRGTVFFEIARILAEKRPPFLLLENVLGLLSHDSGRTLNTHNYTVQQTLCPLTSTYSVVYLFPQAYFNTQFLMLCCGAGFFMPFCALQRSGKEWS